MKLALQYVSDVKGNPVSVMLPVSDWEKIVKKLRHYEQALKLRSDLTEAMQEVAVMEKGKGRKQTLSDFLNEL
ncbi:hypothetical protein GCM10023093_18290 [Nemorincola caseinilytica]|uniref:Prevent-host-death family protein n=1 Tax=Nemorincola caseinilytica TaxID=2054315 RepID=A0ABP8NE23_9BACT